MLKFKPELNKGYKLTMGVVNRGVRNAFRNQIRSFSIIVILGLSIGLSLAMLLAHQAVGQKIDSVKASVGNTITISPAGGAGFEQASNALSSDQLSKVKSTAHVTALNETLTDRLPTTGSDQPFGRGTDSSSTTSLTSPVKLNTNGSGGGRFFVNGGGGNLPTNFSLPVQFLGTNNPSSVQGSTLKVTSGNLIDGGKDTNDAMVSTDMASKNNLKVGSTFTAYNTTLSVVAIFDSGNQGGNNAVVLSLPALQRLSGQSGAITGASATVDSIDNLDSTTNSIKASLGSSADVTNDQTRTQDTVDSLQSISKVSLYSLVGAVAAGAVIIFLTMLMIVRERRREIGVLKAIGASNLKVMFQFMTEAITLTVLGAIVGILIGVVAGNPITHMLVSNSSSSTGQTTANFPGGGRFGGGAGGPAAFGGGSVGAAPRAFNTAGGFRGFRNNLSNINATVGWSIIVYGLVAAIAIAVIGSAVASWFIAKIRPAEVMRVE